MNKTDAILWKFAEPHFDAAASPTPAEESKTVLHAELASEIRSGQTSFWICCGMILLLYIGAFILVLFHLGNTAYVAAVFGVTGVSFTVLIRQMVALWRERARMTLVLRLSDTLPAKDLKPLILILLKAK